MTTTCELESAPQVGAPRHFRQDGRERVQRDEHDSPRFLPEKPVWKRTLEDFGMRSAGWIAAGLHALLGRRVAENVGILMYHRVANRVPGLPPPLHNVAPAAFREQLTGLLARGYRVVPLRELLADRESGERVPPQTIALTFDDGFQTVYTEAFSVLRELRLPATVFVNTAYLDSDQPFPFDAWGVKFADRAPRESWLPLSTAQCREMAASGLVEIGAHTHTHEDFRGRPEAFRRDLERSIDVVGQKFAPAAMTFAFPYGGRHNGFAGDVLADAARGTGVVCGLTTECALVDPHGDPFRWGRFNAFSWDTSRTLAAKLAGWYGWAPHLRKRLAAQLPARRTAARGADA